MALVTDFVDDVRTEVPDATDGVIGTQVLKCVREFLRKTTRWRETLPAVTLVLNQVPYDVGAGASNLVLPADAEIYMFKQAKQNGRPLRIERKEDMRKYGINWDAATGGQIQVVYPTDNTEINCFPIPTDVTYPLILDVVLIPTVSALTVPDFVLNDHQDIITAGTVARLKNLVDTDWYDLAVATAKRGEFLDGVADAAAQIDRGFSTRVRRARPPRMGR